jgi:hypothetical protein
MMRSVILSISILLAATALSHAGLLRDGPEFLVNSYTTGGQEDPDIAASGFGGFVVVWHGDNPDESSSGISGQRYDSAGLSIGGEFQVNSYTTDSQYEAAVAMHRSGGFVVAWTSYGQDGSNAGVFARRFDETGAPVGVDFQVNGYTTGTQYDPDVAIADSGDFVIVWSSRDQYGTDNSVMGRRFDRGGLPVGGEFQIDTQTSSGQYFPQVAMRPSGHFVVVWESNPFDGDGYGIAVRMFSSNGTPDGPEFQANTYTTGDQGEPAIAMQGDGTFLVVWDGDDQDGSEDGVFSQLFDLNGLPIGSELQVNTYTTSQQDDPRVAADTSGEFVVTWPSYPQDASGSAVIGQLVGANGTRVGLEFQVNAYTTGDQTEPSVAAGPAGSFMVVWEDEGRDGSSDGLFGQPFIAHDPGLTGPMGPLDCSDPSEPATLPLFTWDTDVYEAFKVFMGSSPGFEKGTRVTSGKYNIKTGTWKPSRKKWVSACKKALTQSMDPNAPLMYVMIGGIDKDLSRKNPARKRLSVPAEYDVAP